jgi:hypothetical protein
MCVEGAQEEGVIVPAEEEAQKLRNGLEQLRKVFTVLMGPHCSPESAS